ncbi:MAG: hypothetical protein IPM91_18395 [Bacteroidetes bacterium]|nr:hypothetical protein [Bacteroidota bacterium]
MTANSGTSYAWSNGATTQSITVSTSSNYTVTVNSGARFSYFTYNFTVTVAAVTPSQLQPADLHRFAAEVFFDC